MGSIITTSDKVTYDCGLLTNESLAIVDKILKDSMFLEDLKTLGIEIPELKYQPNMHCTFRYMQGEQNQEKREYQLCNDELHQYGTLCVEGIGAYAKDGKLMNIGLYVNEEKSMNEDAFQYVRENLFTNDINHVTIAINRDKDENKKRLGNAADTGKCFMTFGDNPTNGEFSYYVPFESDIILAVTAEAVRVDKVVDELSDYPSERAMREYREEEEWNQNNDEEEIDL